MSNVIACVNIHDSLESLDKDIDLIAQKAKKYEYARHIVDTLVSSKGGRVVGQVQGNEIVEIPVESADILKVIHERIHSDIGLKVEIGVGEDSHQAAEAVAFAKEKAPGSIKVYSPDMEEETSESVKEPEVAVGPDDLMAKSESKQYQAIDPEDKQKIAQTLAMIQQNKELFDQMRQQSPEVYASIVGVVQTLTEIIKYDKIAKEQALVEMIEKINNEVKKEKDKKIKGHAKDIERHIKRNLKRVSKEEEEKLRALSENYRKMRTLRRAEAKDFAKKNGHDAEFLFHLLNKIKD
jgi:hypothetical protein